MVQSSTGFTLIEVAIALAITAIVGVSVSSALVVSRAAAVQARQQTIGMASAQARLAELAALHYETRTGVAGEPVPVTDTTTDLTLDPPATGGTGLTPSPADALWRDRAGYVDYLDAMGRPLGGAAAVRARGAYVRRWAIAAQGVGAAETALVVVLVAPIAIADRATASGRPTGLADAPGVVVIRGAHMRRPA